MIREVFNGLLLCVMFLVAGCDKNRVYEEFRDIKEYTWNPQDTLAFQPEISDTGQAYNLVLHVRNGENYPYRNLYLFLHTGYPDGRFSDDTLEVNFYQEDGTPLGKCSGDICNNTFLLAEQVKFDQAGKYSFNFTHIMRTENNTLPYIMNLGFRIEKAQKAQSL